MKRPKDLRAKRSAAQPTLLIALIMIAFAFVGDGLRDALDPQTNIRK